MVEVIENLCPDHQAFTSLFRKILNRSSQSSTRKKAAPEAAFEAD
jgi:hypothetical protein